MSGWTKRAEEQQAMYAEKVAGVLVEAPPPTVEQSLRIYLTYRELGGMALEKYDRILDSDEFRHLLDDFPDAASAAVR